MKNQKIASKTCTFPISCIAYPKDESILINSISLLKTKYPYIEACYIFHNGEGDDKSHYHLLMRSTNQNGFRNTLDLFQFFTQVADSDIVNRDGKCVYKAGDEVCYIAMRQFIVTNSLGDWLDYAIHQSDYIAQKSLTKEYTYTLDDVKGDFNLIEDCKNHFTYVQNQPQNDLDIILNGVNNNLDSIDIVKQLPGVNSTNLFSVLNGIKAVRNNVGVNEELAFQHYFPKLLMSYGFDFEKLLDKSKASRKSRMFANENELLFEVVEMFVKWCDKQNYDIIDILLG